jgi:hypothetical protein
MHNHHKNTGKTVADLIKLASYSDKLSRQLNENSNLESWVQDKITKATDALASVYHYVEYESKFNDYSKHLAKSTTLSEGQKSVIKARLNEAKEKMKELKKAQAEKVKEKKMDEGILSGGERPCTECGGTGMVYEEPKQVPAHVKSKVDAYKRLTKATHAAHKRLDANNNGIPDEDEMEEGFGEAEPKEMKVGDKKKTRTGELEKTSTGVKHTNTSYADDGEAEDKSGKGKKSHAKAQSAAEKKDRAPAQKQSPKSAKTWGMKDGEKFDNRDKEVDETYGQGVYEAKKKGDGNLANNAKPYDKITRGDVIAGRLGKDEKGGKTVKEAEQKTMSRAAKGMMKYGKDGMKALAKAGKEGKDLDKVRDKYDKYDEAVAPTKDMPKKGEKIGKEGNAFGKAVQDAKASGDKTMTVGGKTMPVKEASKPSAGLSAAKKSAVVKKAKAGGDIGKPGKSFDKVAKSAGGGEKGEKIAAAAMWKNMKETTAYMAEKKAATKDLPGNQEKIDVNKNGKIDGDDLAKLRAGKKEVVKESADLNRMKQLMTRLNG